MTDRSKPVLPLLAVAFLFLASGVTAAQAADPWRFDVVPYVWGTGLEGTQAFGPFPPIELDASVGDLVEFLDAGGSLRFEARSNPWGWYVEGNYFRLEHEKTIMTGTISAVVKQTIGEAGIIHRINDKAEAYLGTRYQSVDTRIDFPLVGTGEGDPDWMDGILGVRWTPVRSDLGAVWVRADIGTGGSNFTWLAEVGGAYRFNKTWSVVAAYRYLDTDFESSAFTWDMVQSGFGIGAGISW
jgi:hypothetical protein